MQGHYCSMKFALFATVTAPRNPQCPRKTPGRQEVAREVFQNRREVRGRATQDTASIRTREHVTDHPQRIRHLSRTTGGAKAAAQDIIGRKKQQKEAELGFERTHFSQQVESHSSKHLYFKSIWHRRN